MKYQVTLLCADGKYRPVSSIVTIENGAETDLLDAEIKKKIVKKGIEKICVARNWTQRDLKNFNYSKSKIRVYDKEKIDRENQERYARIKEEKYASGEWKRPNK